MARENVLMSNLFIVQSFPKWFVHFWKTFCKNSIRTSCQIIFVQKKIGLNCVKVPLMDSTLEHFL